MWTPSRPPSQALKTCVCDKLEEAALVLDSKELTTVGPDLRGRTIEECVFDAYDKVCSTRGLVWQRHGQRSIMGGHPVMFAACLCWLDPDLPVSCLLADLLPDLHTDFSPATMPHIQPANFLSAKLQVFFFAQSRT